MKNRILFISLSGLFLGLGWFYLRRNDKRQKDKIASPVLLPGVKEKLVIDPVTHTLRAVTQSGSHTIYLSNRPSSVELTDKGELKITDKQFGTELTPTIGFAYGDLARIALGLNLFYWHRWDLGLSLYPSVSGSFSLKAGPTISYNVYDNTSLFVGIVSGLSPMGGLSLKF